MDELVDAFENLKHNSPEDEYEILMDAIHTKVYTFEQVERDITRYKRYIQYINFEISYVPELKVQMEHFINVKGMPITYYLTKASKIDTSIFDILADYQE